MPYTRIGPFVDGGPPYLSAADLNQMEAGIASANPATTAPPPSGDKTGATDQAALQALITSVQAAGGGTLVLQAGTYYVTGLVTTQQQMQPRIIGQGKTATVLVGVGSNPVIRWRGVPGTISSGWIGFLQIQGSAVGMELAGICGLKWQQLLFYGPLTESIRFHNEVTTDFTEFCQGEAEFASTRLGPALRYMTVQAGIKSFHGSGLTEGSIINQPSGATWPEIQVDQYCLPYNAPMTAQIFIRNPAQPVIRNQNTSDYVNWRGQLTVEQFAANCVIFDPTGQPIYYTGSLNAFGYTGLTVGNVVFVDRIWTPASSAYPVFVRRPYATNTVLAAGATPLVTLDQRSSYLVSVRISDAAGSVYYYDQLLYVVLKAHESDGKGAVSVVATTVNVPDTGTLGPPVYSLNANVLTVTNAGYSSALTAQVGVTTANPWVPLA